MKPNEKEDFEATCQLFINSVNNYFEHLTKVKSETSVPYLKTSKDVLLKEYTGMIGISGNKKGFVYISGDKDMYVKLLSMFLKIEDPNTDRILDIAGELCNVVAGNVRETYGKDFMISVPIVFKGMPERLNFPQDLTVFVIPINWDNLEAVLVIGLE